MQQIATTTRAKWDTELARQLWDKGWTQRAIAKKSGTTKHAISKFAIRHAWPDRECDKTTQSNNSAYSSLSRTKPLRRGSSTLPPLQSEL